MRMSRNRDIIVNIASRGNIMYASMHRKSLGGRVWTMFRNRKTRSESNARKRRTQSACKKRKLGNNFGWTTEGTFGHHGLLSL